MNSQMKRYIEQGLQGFPAQELLSQRSQIALPSQQVDMFTNTEASPKLVILRFFTFIMIKFLLCRHNWFNHWLWVIECNLQPLSLPQRLRSGAESSNPLVIWLVFLAASPPLKLSSPVYPHIHTWIISLTYNRPSYHSGNSKVLEALCQKPGTNQIYFLLYYRQSL